MAFDPVGALGGGGPGAAFGAAFGAAAFGAAAFEAAAFGSVGVPKNWNIDGGGGALLEEAPGVSISSSGLFIGFVFTLSLPFDLGAAFAALFGAAFGTAAEAPAGNWKSDGCA